MHVIIARNHQIIPELSGKEREREREGEREGEREREGEIEPNREQHRAKSVMQKALPSIYQAKK